jgi:hypothetical protein
MNVLHVVRAGRAASALADSVRRLTAWNCADANQALREAVRVVAAEYVTRQQAYDRRTRHGGRQGAYLPSADGCGSTRTRRWSTRCRGSASVAVSL